MDPVTAASWVALIGQVISMMITVGQSVIDMAPYVAMFFQVVAGTPLTPDQQADLNAKHAALTEAALRPLPDAPEGAT